MHILKTEECAYDYRRIYIHCNAYLYSRNTRVPAENFQGQGSTENFQFRTSRGVDLPRNDALMYIQIMGSGFDSRSIQCAEKSAFVCNAVHYASKM